MAVSKEILNTGLFNWKKQVDAGWIEKAEKYGISSFVYRSKNHLILLGLDYPISCFNYKE